MTAAGECAPFTLSQDVDETGILAPHPHAGGPEP